MQFNQTEKLSAAARQRFERLEGTPPFTSDWLHTVMIHFAVDSRRLQPMVPFELDLRDGRAFVSLVAFDMHRLRPTRLGKLGEALFGPIGNHPFLNVRTYVRDADETGIYFLTEYLPKLLSVPLGPPVFGLPYRWGRLAYQNRPTTRGRVHGCVCKGWNGPALEYEGTIQDSAYRAAASGSLTEFLMERYTAFTYWRGIRRRFRIWHKPWTQATVNIDIKNDALLREQGDWYVGAELCGANYSPGVRDVWMGRPRFVRRQWSATFDVSLGKAVMR